MFDYPLSIPPDTLYHQLGVYPEATSDEIRDAKNNVRARIADERAAVEKALDAVYQAVDGLRECYRRMRELQEGKGEESEDRRKDEIKRVSQKLAELEPKAIRLRPDLKQLREQLAEFEVRINELNRTPLENPKQQEQYDQAHPPLALLKLADCTRDGFVDSRTALMLLRREISQFLTQRGESAYHPSDLTREDFTDDFSAHPRLDGERDE